MFGIQGVRQEQSWHGKLAGCTYQHQTWLFLALIVYCMELDKLFPVIDMFLLPFP